MLSSLFSSVADALISYAIDKLDPAETLKTWLKGEPAKLAFEKTLARAYAAFARQYPEYTSSLFDQSFLSKEALPELSKLLTRNLHPDPALLAQAWGNSIGADVDFAQIATKPASYFLERLEAELKAESALQALFDSRALESLPKLEADIQKLTRELQRGLDEALKIANHYQKATVSIGGNVTNSNIIIGDNNTVNQYYYSGDFVSLNEYYIPPDGVFQRVRVDEFVGREWLTAKVDAFLDDPNQKSGAFLLVGDAGVGKTAFMAHLVKERRYLHLFAEQVPGQAMLQRALQSLGSQLVTRYQIDPYKDRDTLNVLAGFPDFLERLLRLAASTLTEGEKIVIVCDALDEAGVFPDHFVFGLPKELPDGVYLILSQRPVNTKLPNFEPLRFDLEAQGEDNLQDMEDYLSSVAKRSTVAGQIRARDYSEDFFIQTLKEKSLGVWMYLHYITKEIEEGARAPLDLANLPKGLVGYYADYWDDWRYGRKGRGKGEEAWNELYAPLLTTLAAAQDAITAERLTTWAGVKIDSDDVDILLHDKWRSFILEREVEGNILYAPYHLSFRDFITGKVDISKLPIIEQANLVRDFAKKTVRAHKRIVNAFEAECNGEWEKLVEQDYPRLHLTAHLNGAKEYKKLTNLLTEGDEKIKWAEAREKKEETYAGYLNDLTYVWDYAEREQNYALAIRCMLIENSISSLASNIPPKLVVELAKSDLWSYARSLSTIRQKTSPFDQAESLKEIASNLPRVLFGEALAIAVGIKKEFYCVEVLSVFAPYLSEELKSRALSIARGLKDEFTLSRALSELAPYMSEELKSRALSIARGLKDEFARARALSELAPYMSESLQTQVVQEAFAAASEVKDQFYRARALSELAPHLPEDLKAQALQDALAAAREIKDPLYYVIALSRLSFHLPEDLKAQALQDALPAVRGIRDEIYRASALSELAPYLTEELKRQAFAVLGEIDNESYRASALSALAPHLTEELKSQALSIARGLKDEFTRARALSELALHLTEELKNQATQEALAAALAVKEESNRAVALSELAPHLTEKLKRQTLQDALAATLDAERIRVVVLSTLASHLTEELKNQALDIAYGIKDGSKRARALSALGPHLTEELKAQVLQDALAAAREINDEAARAGALAALGPYLTNELKSQALEAACEIRDEHTRAHALFELVPHLTEDLRIQALQEAVAAARETKDEYFYAYALSVPISYLTEDAKFQALQEAFAAAREIKNEANRARALTNLAPHWSQELISQVLAATHEIRDEWQRATALYELVPYLTEDLKAQALQDALAAAREIRDEFYRAFTLAGLLSHLSVDAKAQALRDAFVAASEVRYEDARAVALSELAPYLTEDLKEPALATAREIKDENARIHALLELAPFLTEELTSQVLQEALGAAREVKKDSNRALALSEVAPHLATDLRNQVLQEALVAAHEIRSESDRASVLSALVPHLTEQLKSEALAVANEISDKSNRALALSALAPRLSTELTVKIFQDILFAVETVRDYKDILEEWEKIEFEGVKEIVFGFLRVVSQRNRDDGLRIVEMLIPALLRLAEKAIIKDIFRTIIDTARWWP